MSRYHQYSPWIQVVLQIGIFKLVRVFKSLYAWLRADKSCQGLTQYNMLHLTTRMMASYTGRVGEFCRDKETFSAYVERKEMIFAVNNIIETTGTDIASANRRIAEQNNAIFLTEVGPEVFSVLSNLLSPAKPKDTSLEDIVQKLKNHFDPCSFGDYRKLSLRYAKSTDK